MNNLIKEQFVCCPCCGNFFLLKIDNKLNTLETALIEKDCDDLQDLKQELFDKGICIG